MFKTFLFVGYSRRVSNYQEIITLSDPTHTMNMIGPISINVEILRIDSGCSLEKEFTKWIHINI